MFVLRFLGLYLFTFECSGFLDTFRKFKERNLNKPGQKEAETLKKKKDLENEIVEAEIGLNLKIGSRCELNSGVANARRGCIAFVGMNVGWGWRWSG